MHGHDGKFYYFHTFVLSRAFISLCDRVPQGLLHISHLCWWTLQVNKDMSLQVNSGIFDNTDPKVMYEKYEKDRVVQHYI